MLIQFISNSVLTIIDCLREQNRWIDDYAVCMSAVNALVLLSHQTGIYAGMLLFCSMIQF